jgi:hypothetical protein
MNSEFALESCIMSNPPTDAPKTDSVAAKEISVENTSPQRLPEPTPQPTERPQSGIGFFHKTLTNIWFYIAAVSLVANVVHTFSPTMQASATSLNPNDPAGSIFTVTNTSPWTFTEVHFSCDVNSGTARIYVADNSQQSGRGSPIEGPVFTGSIGPGEPVTRDCGLGSSSSFIRIPVDPARLRIDFAVSYKWLFGYAPGSLTRHFNTRRTGNGTFVLVPDLEGDRLALRH